MMISNLPSDLVEEVLSRVSVTSMRAVRSTCRKWNSLSKDTSFKNKQIGKAAASAAAREREFVMIMGDLDVHLVSLNLHGTTHSNNVDLSINPRGRLVRLDSSGPVLYSSEVFHCNGLLLCITGNMTTRLVVLNPYWRTKKRCIEPRYDRQSSAKFAIGYDKSCGSHKILRIFYTNLEIYDLSSNSNSWRVSNATLGRNILVCGNNNHGVSVKGNTYWRAKDISYRGEGDGEGDGFLLCFDFTSERFGPPLPLPCNNSSTEVYVSLSSVREEQLVAVFERWRQWEIEIWVTNEIEPDAVSWTSFVKLGTIRFRDIFKFGNFFIDEEKKVAVVFDDYRGASYQTAHIINGETGHVTNVDLTESPYARLRPLLCSYLPSSVQI